MRYTAPRRCRASMGSARHARRGGRPRPCRPTGTTARCARERVCCGAAPCARRMPGARPRAGSGRPLQCSSCWRPRGHRRWPRWRCWRAARDIVHAHPMPARSRTQARQTALQTVVRPQSGRPRASCRCLHRCPRSRRPLAHLSLHGTTSDPSGSPVVAPRRQARHVAEADLEERGKSRRLRASRPHRPPRGPRSHALHAPTALLRDLRTATPSARSHRPDSARPRERRRTSCALDGPRTCPGQTSSCGYGASTPFAAPTAEGACA